MLNPMTSVADGYRAANASELSQLSFRREPTSPDFAAWVAGKLDTLTEIDQGLTAAQRSGLLLDRPSARGNGIDPNLGPAGTPHYLYPEAEAHGIDQGGNGATIGNAVITFAVLGTASAGALEWDQAWFASQIGDIPLDATYAIATVTPSSTRFTNAQVADFLSFQPFCMVNMNLVAASADAIVSGLQMVPIRLTPFGTSSESTIYNLQYQTTQDFQTSRGQIPFSEIVDGYTYMRLITPIQAVAATYSVSFLCGLRPDRRSQVPKLPPQLLNSSGVAR